MYMVGGDCASVSTEAYEVQKRVWELLELDMPDMELGTEFMASAKGSACS